MADWFGLQAQDVIPGAIGGVVAALTKKGHWREKARVFVIGTLSAYFLSPLVLPVLEFTFGRTLAIDSTRLASMSGFLAGATAVVLIEIVLRAFTNRVNAISASAPAPRQEPEE